MVSNSQKDLFKPPYTMVLVASQYYGRGRLKEVSLRVEAIQCQIRIHSENALGHTELNEAWTPRPEYRTIGIQNTNIFHDSYSNGVFGNSISAFIARFFLCGVFYAKWSHRTHFDTQSKSKSKWNYEWKSKLNSIQNSNQNRNRIENKEINNFTRYSK